MCRFVLRLWFAFISCGCRFETAFVLVVCCRRDLEGAASLRSAGLDLGLAGIALERAEKILRLPSLGITGWKR